MRGLLTEFGIILPQGIGHLCRRVPDILADGENGLPGPMRACCADCSRSSRGSISRLHSSRAKSSPCISTTRTAKDSSASAASAAHRKRLRGQPRECQELKNGPQVAAWLGLVPRQESSGGKTRLLGISKHGDVDLCTLLTHGARAARRHLEHRAHRTDDWLRRLLARRDKNVAAVALANKNACVARRQQQASGPRR